MMYNDKMTTFSGFFKNRPENIFWVLGLVFGCVYLIITPPFQVADENRHFYRAFQVAEGVVISEVHNDKAGGWLPVNAIQCGDSTLYMRWDADQKITQREILDLFQLKLDLAERRFKPFCTYVYSPVAYLPVSCLIRVGIWLKWPPLTMMYAGRLVNLLCWLGLVYAAIRITPFYKWVFLLLALMPTSLYQAASLSADCLTNGLAFITIAFFLRLIFVSDIRMNAKKLSILLLLTMALSLTKNIFFLISLLVILIPSEKYGSKKQRWGWCISVVGLNLLLFLGWCFVITRLPTLGKADVYPDQQIKFIISSPIEYCQVLVNTLVQNLSGYYRSFVGAFGWQDVRVSKWHGYLVGGLVLMAALTGGCGSVRVKCWHKILFLFIITTVFLSILTLNYIHWNPVKNDVICDVQGRYFIPISSIFCLLFYNTRYRTASKYLPVIFVAGTLISLSYACSVFYLRFYV